nr:uncharacterized protein LOC113739006 [Coffea arabica]
MAVAPNNYAVYGKRIAEEAPSETAVAYNKYDVSGNRIAEAPPVAAATFLLSEPDDAENASDSEKRETIQEDEEKENSSSSSNTLPECLLLMMCEPKLSMKVSKETWVCSTDFVRWLPERRPAAAVTNQKLVNAPEDPKMEVSCTDSNHPPPPPMGPSGERRGNEPFVLTRCKSEPMRTAATKLMPEACFWKNRKLGWIFLIRFCFG